MLHLRPIGAQVDAMQSPPSGPKMFLIPRSVDRKGFDGSDNAWDLQFRAGTFEDRCLYGNHIFDTCEQTLSQNMWNRCVFLTVF